MAHPFEQAAAQAIAPPQLDHCPIPSPEGFEDFFRSAWRPLTRTAMIYGATLPEAEDAASDALTYMLPRWPIPDRPMAFAHRLTLHYFLKARVRGNLRVARRLVERAHVPHREGAEDGRLVQLEELEWVTEVLGHLTPAQREVMEHIANGLNYAEIASILGKSGEVVRRRVADARKHLTQILAPNGTYKTGKEAL